ncbi:MAG: hypothetical protein HY744_14365 [Deltaproteobacteria bacterium]|nr:hypothetical protein [Deltaproteobacteria bacterium]
MPALHVEPMASELLVSVSSARDPVHMLQLVSPSAVVVEAASASARAAAFRVASPEAGTWTWKLKTPTLPPPAPGDPPAVFVEQAVRSPARLYAEADVLAAWPSPAQGGAYEDGRFVSADVAIRALLADAAPILGATVTAKVRDPVGVNTMVTLRDDGKHADSAKGDGVYGALFTGTAWPGVYAVYVSAEGKSNVVQGAIVWRERHVAFALHSGADDDGDRLPNWYERQHSTSPTGLLASTDDDGDGLTNLQEYAAHTQPLVADSDGGGESDGSELAARLDPLDPRDDRASVFTPRIVPGNVKALVDFQVPRSLAAQVELQRASARDGVFSRRYLGPSSEAPLSDPAPNDAQACYRMRTTVAGATSDWSEPDCVLPRRDPFAPDVTLSLAQGGSITTTREIGLRIDASESPNPDLYPERLVDTETQASELADMMVSTRADFLGASYQPFRARLSLVAPNTPRSAVYVKVRDSAGNEPEPQDLLVRLVDPPQLEPVPEFIGKLGGYGSEPGQFNFQVTGVAVDEGTGEVFVSDPRNARICRFDREIWRPLVRSTVDPTTGIQARATGDVATLSLTANADGEPEASVTAGTAGGTSLVSFTVPTTALDTELCPTPCTIAENGVGLSTTRTAGSVVYSAQTSFAPGERKVFALTTDVTLCHVPPGKPKKRHSIVVDAPAWPAHRAHGDYLGRCLGG